MALKTGKNAQVITGLADDWPALQNANSAYDSAYDSGNVTTTEISTSSVNSAVNQTCNVRFCLTWGL